MKSPIITIPRASESTIQALVNAGILEVTEEGIKVAENREVLQPESKKDSPKKHCDYNTEKEYLQ